MWKRQGCNQLQDYCNNSGDDLYQGGSTGVIHLCEGCSQFWPQSSRRCWYLLLLLLLLSRFSHVRLCATPETAAHQAPQSLGFSRQEHWSGLPFPSPMHENEKWKQSCSVVSDSSWSHGLQPTGLLHPWDFQARVLEWGAIAFSVDTWGSIYVSYHMVDEYGLLR